MDGNYWNARYFTFNTFSRIVIHAEHYVTYITYIDETSGLQTFIIMSKIKTVLKNQIHWHTCMIQVTPDFGCTDCTGSEVIHRLQIRFCAFVLTGLTNSFEIHFLSLEHIITLVLSQMY